VQRQPVDIAGAISTIGAATGSAVSGLARHEDHSVAEVPSVTEEAVPEVVTGAIADAHTAIAELRTHAAELAELADRRHVDLDDPVDLDELATRLYGRLRSKLRLELIVDRERAGLLTDFR